MSVEAPVRNDQGTDRRAWGGLLLLTAILLSAPSRGQAQSLLDERSVELDRFRPAFDASGFLTIPATRPPGPEQWDLGLWLGYENQSLLVRDAGSGNERPVLDHRLRGRFTGSLGFGGRIAAGISVPFVIHQRGQAEALADDRDSLVPAAAGDVRLGLLVRAVGEPARPVRERPQGFGLAFQGQLVLPSGTDQSFVSEPNARTELRAIADYHLFGLGAALSLGWLHRFDQRELLGVTLRDELDAALGLAVPIPAPQAPTLLFELRTTVDARAPFQDAARTAVEVDAAARFRFDALALTAGVGAGLTDGVGVPRVRAFAAVHYGPRVRDADLDGVPDDQDQCRQLAEDRDGFEDDDGCLDPDDDLDGVLDADDRCPREPVDFENDQDEDGCPDDPSAGPQAT